MRMGCGNVAGGPRPPVLRGPESGVEKIVSERVVIDHAFKSLTRKTVTGCLGRTASCRSTILTSASPRGLRRVQIKLHQLQATLRIFTIKVSLPGTNHRPGITGVKRGLNGLHSLSMVRTALHSHCLPSLPSTRRCLLVTILSRLSRRHHHDFGSIGGLLNDGPCSHAVRDLRT